MVQRSLLFVLLFSLAAPLQADDMPLEFADADLQQRYNDLIEEVRCLVCQNQSLADSTADLAQDLRLEIYEMIVAGRNNEEIITFLVQRYGDFVLYRPPFKQSTWLLWFAPFLFLAGSIIAVVYFVRKSPAATATGLNEAERDRLSTLLANEDKENN
jgi:cytochrome c-type biogenesis protein CcmH